MNTEGPRNHSAWEYAKANLCSLGAKSRCCSNDMSLVMRNTFFCICENKDADQLRGDREADQRLCFHYTDSTIPLIPGLCRTWSETPKTGFLTTRLIFSKSVIVNCGTSIQYRLEMSCLALYFKGHNVGWFLW